MNTLELTKQKDPGRIHTSDEVFPPLKLRDCVLSMSGADSRSSFTRCNFGPITAVRCTIGHPIFDQCTFKDIVSNLTVTTYESLFMECRFAGKLQNINFGSIRKASPFFSEQRFASDQAALSSAAFSIDITNVESLVECAFLGDLFNRKLRFRKGQGVLIEGTNLDSLLKPLLVSTDDLELATFLSSPVGFGSTQTLHFLPAPTGSPNRLATFVQSVQERGVQIHREPLC